MPTQPKKPKKKVKTTLPFYIGSDPEYLLFYGKRGLNAKHMIQNFFQNGDYSPTSAGFLIPSVGDFGWDGASSTGELRPDASKDIRKHVDFLRKMLKTINKELPFVDISTLSIGSPIGGHIHVDSWIHADPELFSSAMDSLNTQGKKIRNRADKIMSTYLLPIVASDHRISAMARLQGSYGKLNDFKYETKTNSVTAEIRGLTAEWLTTPEIAYATLAYVATVWHEISINHEKLNKLKFILRHQSHCDSVHRLLLSDYDVVSGALAKEIKKSVKEFALYPQFKKEIDFILNPKKVYETKEKAGWNINKGWGFTTKFPKITKRSLMTNDAVRAVLAKENVPNIERSFAVNYNDDYNVSLFAKAISERVATLHWPLKNTYALFGFRKGVEGLTAYQGNGNYYAMSSNQPKAKTIETTELMYRRLAEQNTYGSARINPKTGRTIGKESETIVIGLPYDIRATDNIAPMIELIWKIEKGQLPLQESALFAVDPGEVNKTERPDMETGLENADRNMDGSHDERMQDIINQQTD